MTQAIPKYETYYQMGRAAYLGGLRCAPSCDQKFMDGYNHQWKGAKIGDAQNKERNAAARAWADGWTMENRKATM